MSTPINQEDTIQNLVDLIKKFSKCKGNIQEKIDTINYMGEYRVNRDILKTTLAGKKMTTWSRSKNKEIKEAAKRVLNEWKTQIKGVNKSSGSSGKSTRSGSTQSQNKSLSEKGAEEKGLVHPDSVVPDDSKPNSNSSEDENEGKDDETKSPEDEEDYDEFILNNETEDKVRNGIRKGLEKLLCKSNENPKKCKALSIKIENSVVLRLGTHLKEYTNKCRSIIANLQRSDEFRSKIINGIFTPDDLAAMNPRDFLEDSLKKKRAKKETRIIDSKRSDYILANSKIKEGMYTCEKCKSKKTTFYEQQTRSADEPMTTFVQCLMCSHNMKF
ncbi:unnamed protein product [Moneuplotes crassus]|uniref:Transcription elongation factor TFIIS n=2 Tax=Euplotes crassus TaxID=5936 RepID=Q9GZ09_EUPCR|nr:transcription elongation factor TFIIS [Moneuplotes crassus]CAI2374566.1 unnamed protein product [Moneuplotes crassus]